MFEPAQVGIVLADAGSCYLDANLAACRLFGYAREEFVGLHASNILVPAALPHVGDALREFHGRADHRREWRCRR